MLITILAVIYITFICRGYGLLLFAILRRATRRQDEPLPSFPVTFFMGLAVAGVFFTAYSLFFAVGTIVTQLVLLLPCLLGMYTNRQTLAASFSKDKLQWLYDYKPLLALAFVTVAGILVMHAGIVNHPDTLAYHAPNIRWTEQYKAVPGIVHLNLNYGTQSSWFVLCALFSFDFAKTGALTFINAAVLVWFVLFIVQRIYYSLREQRLLHAGCWLLLLGFACWSYTQIRLTASSASPDFIAALYAWLVFYLFVTSTSGNALLPAATFFLACFAITIKLSALPCLLPALYAWFRYANAKALSKILFVLCTGIATVAPFLARNAISTGYLLYPSAAPDLINADWKLRHNELLLFRQYITGYARAHVLFDKTQILSVTDMHTREWIPGWWRLQSYASKTLLAATLLCFFFSLLFIKKITERSNSRLLAAIACCMAGIAFWFVQAPDPRFGFGVLIPFIALVILSIGGERKWRLLRSNWIGACMLLLAGINFGYVVYRCREFIRPVNLIKPAGITSTAYRTMSCHGVSITIPATGLECGDSPAPCTTQPCEHFMPRGNKVEDGFVGE